MWRKSLCTDASINISIRLWRPIDWAKASYFKLGMFTHDRRLIVCYTAINETHLDWLFGLMWKWKSEPTLEVGIRRPLQLLGCPLGPSTTTRTPTPSFWPHVTLCYSRLAILTVILENPTPYNIYNKYNEKRYYGYLKGEKRGGGERDREGLFWSMTRRNDYL